MNPTSLTCCLSPKSHPGVNSSLGHSPPSVYYSLLLLTTRTIIHSIDTITLNQTADYNSWILFPIFLNHIESSAQIMLNHIAYLLCHTLTHNPTYQIRTLTSSSPLLTGRWLSYRDDGTRWEQQRFVKLGTITGHKSFQSFLGPLLVFLGAIL